MDLGRELRGTVADLSHVVPAHGAVHEADAAHPRPRLEPARHQLGPRLLLLQAVAERKGITEGEDRAQVRGIASFADVLRYPATQRVRAEADIELRALHP